MSAQTRKKRKRSGLLIFLGIGAALIILFVWMLMTGRSDGNPVQYELVEVRDLISSVTESGTVEPVTEVKIAADVSGEIITLNTKEGMQVKKNDVLVTVRPDNYQSALEQAEAALNSALASQLQAAATKEQSHAQFLQDSANFARQDTLFRQKVISRMEWENARLAYEVARARYRGAIASEQAASFTVGSRRASLKNAQTDLRKTTILASMDGTITRQNVKQGERVVGTLQMAGTELFRIADLSAMQVNVQINENDIIHVRSGDSALVEVDAFEDRKFRGTVTDIAYSAAISELGTDQITSFDVAVRIDPASYINDPSLMRGLEAHQSPFRPGMSAQVEIFTDRVDDVFSVPIQAVTVRRPKGAPEDADPVEVVFVLKDLQTVEMREVKTGISDDTYIAILEGLQAGDRVVSGPYKLLSKDLKDGMKVKVSQDDVSNLEATSASSSEQSK